MEVDNEAIGGIIEEYDIYCSYMYSVVQYMYCKQWMNWRELDCRNSIQTSYKSYWGKFTRRKWIVGKKTKIIEVRRRILARHDALIPNKIIDVEINLLLLREIEKTNDILREATVMHNLLAKRLWRYKIWNKFGIPDSYNNSDSDIVE